MAKAKKTTAKTTRKSAAVKKTSKKATAKTTKSTSKSVKDKKHLSKTQEKSKKTQVRRSRTKEQEQKPVQEIKTVTIPRKPAYSKKELEYFKQIILEKRKEIIEQLELLRERMVDENTGTFVNENSPYSLHMAEQGTDSFEKEKNYLWAQRETKFLSYLDAALRRIEDGSYGYCIDCGAVIEKGRLEAVPHTQHCMKCKVKFSK